MLFGKRCSLPDGAEVALDILNSYVSSSDVNPTEGNETLISVGREILARANFSIENWLGDCSTATVVRYCLSGGAARPIAEVICKNVRVALDQDKVTSYNCHQTLAALFETQPFVALDSFLLPNLPRAWDLEFDGDSPIETHDIAILKEWACRDPNARYPLIGRSIRMFKSMNGSSGEIIPSLFTSILELAPNKRLFLSSVRDQVQPSGWSGSLADILIGRKACLMKLAESVDPHVLSWVTEFVQELDRWISHHRRYDRASEESFE